MKRGYLLDVVAVGLVAVFIVLYAITCRGYCNNVTSDSEVNYVYVICDVYDIVYNGDYVEIDIVLPNAELLTRQMSVDSDLPEEFTEVVIQTADLDDYSTYKIVGVR